jgi:hypothetical protein
MIAKPDALEMLAQIGAQPVMSTSISAVQVGTEEPATIRSAMMRRIVKYSPKTLTLKC